ncbi:MAG TPA: helix-turn-helix domain-containing protein [Thermohalobaculum sp.]|nr:helix-turn-helix domain-containing protein [Thermohalobaculum sp.]
MPAVAQFPIRPVREVSPQALADQLARPARALARRPLAGVEAPRQLTFGPGDTLYFDGDIALHFFEIVSGTVRCCRLTPDGRRQIYRFADAGDMLGLGGEIEHGHAAEAVTKVVARRHRLPGLDAALARDGQLRERVLGALREELAAVRLQMMLLGRMSATEKVASFLLARAARAADPVACPVACAVACPGACPGAPVHLPMTRADIADYLGLTIETVSRKISELKRLGVIALNTPTDLCITRHDRLRAMAEAA